MPRRKNISRQTQQLLSALADAPQVWRYGYDLCKQTGLKSGTLYPILMRLKDQGFLDAEWQPPQQTGKPPRQLYRLTPSGLVLAQHQQAAVPQPPDPLGAVS